MGETGKPRPAVPALAEAFFGQPKPKTPPERIGPYLAAVVLVALSWALVFCAGLGCYALYQAVTG